MKIKNYNRFSDLPFAELGEAVTFNLSNKDEIVKEFSETCGLVHKTEWFMPQLIAHISQFRVTREIDQETGEISFSPKKLLRENMGGNPWNQGIYYLCMHSLRGDIIKGQYKAPGVDYCCLVPLLLLPFKKLHNIEYSLWVRDELRHVLDPKLLEAVEYKDETQYVTEEIIEIRDRGLLVKTGNKAGSIRNPSTTFKLYGNVGLGDMPWLHQVMKTQIWCAHPSNRHQYMILDPANLDNVPEPLVSTEVLFGDTSISFTAKNKTPTSTIREALPWE